MRILVLKRLYKLSDEQMEYQLLDRMSYKRFCGLANAVNLPDRTTVWAFENRMRSLGCALMTNPDLLILDEATKGLAPLIVREIWRVICEIRDSGIATVIVDKNHAVVTSPTDRSMIVVKGQVVFDGLSEGRAQQPRTRPEASRRVSAATRGYPGMAPSPVASPMSVSPWQQTAGSGCALFADSTTLHGSCRQLKETRRMHSQPIGQRHSWGRRSACVLFAAQAFGFSQASLADGPDAEIRELRTMIEALQQKIDKLERTNSEKAAAAIPAAAAPRAGNLLPEGLKIYGSLDSGVERVTNVGASKKTLSRVPSITGSGPSIIGLDFRRSVGDTVTAIGKAEMGLFLDTGSSGQGGRIFGRQLYVGADTPLGSITFGRQYTMLIYGLLGSEILGPNIYGVGSIDAYLPNARADNSVVWRAKFDKLSLGAHYSFGRETINNTVPVSGVCGGEDATDASRCRGWSAMARYDDPKFGISAAIDTQQGGTGAQASFFNGGAPIAMSSDGDKDRRMTVNGYVRFGAFKLGAGWLGRKVDTRTTDVEQDITWLGGEYVLSPKWTIDGSFFHVDNDTQRRRADLYVLRGAYNFDEQFSAYLTAGYVDNSGTAAYGVSSGGAGAAPAAGNAQLGTMAGVRYRF